MLLAIAAPDQVSELVRNGGWTQASELEAFGITHEELSAEILEQWRLPMQILQAVDVITHRPGIQIVPRWQTWWLLGNLYAEATGNELELTNSG